MGANSSCDLAPVNAHYNDAYFRLQKSVGELAEANAWMFRDFVGASDVVVDFGCGGGFLLRCLDTQRRIGVEVNPAAIEDARMNGIEIVNDLLQLPPDSVDVVISNHALEHTTDPFEKLRLARRALKSHGLAIFVVPCERYDTPYLPRNFDQHLYTWAPVNLGNLFMAAGFQVLSCERIAHRLPPRAALFRRLLGASVFHYVCRGYAYLRPGLTQVRAVGIKL